MRKAARLFEIIQILRLAKRPVTAAEIGKKLEVVARSVYRDIAALQGMHVPIEGSRGIGYHLRPGFQLPPLMFTVEEVEAIVVALGFLDRIADAELKQAARRVNQKIAGAVPAPLRQTLESSALLAWGPIAAAPDRLDLALVRRAIRTEQKLQIAYRDQTDRSTSRKIWPLAVIYYSETTNVVAWCELRQSLRTFRADRVQESAAIDEFFPQAGDRLREEWMAAWGSAQ